MWKTKGRIRSLDVEALWETLTSIVSESGNLFPKTLDTIRWTLATKDHHQTGSESIDFLASLKKELSGNTQIILQIQLYHQEKTKGLGIELFADTYLDLTIDRFRSELTVEIATIGLDNANKMLKQILAAVPITRAHLAEHHAYLEPFVNKLLEDHPDYERNVFLIMRFQKEAPFPDILSSLKTTCEENGLTLLRADDREYAADLWDNVLTYIYGCSAAIAIFDQINYREFNPNVAIEVGFMQALGKPLLLLKDQAIAAMPTDVISKIYRPFNTYQATTTIPPQVNKWIADYRLARSYEIGT